MLRALNIETKKIIESMAVGVDPSYQAELNKYSWAVAGLKCPKCDKGVITKTKFGNALYCTERPNCKFWVNL